VLPFCRTDGLDAKTYGLNTIGLKRNGFSDERVEALQKAYRILVKSKLNTSQALDRIAEELPGQPDVEELVRFIKASERGFIK
jgi:UDP-N-acetylglucosamine acyltransferase